MLKHLVRADGSGNGAVTARRGMLARAVQNMNVSNAYFGTAPGRWYACGRCGQMWRRIAVMAHVPDSLKFQVLTP